MHWFSITDVMYIGAFKCREPLQNYSIRLAFFHSPYFICAVFDRISSQSCSYENTLSTLWVVYTRPVLFTNSQRQVFLCQGPFDIEVI